jgi:transporter family protein
MAQQENRSVSTWLVWALLSACFAALTAVFAKVGVAKIEPDVATLIRTIVILIVLSGIVVASGLATGASWLCYFRALHVGDAARVAPIDKLSVVLVAAFGVTFLGEKLSAINWVGVALIAAGAWLVTLRL